PKVMSARAFRAPTKCSSLGISIPRAAPLSTPTSTTSSPWTLRETGLKGASSRWMNRFLHLEIMKARSDVTSVVHAHPTYAPAFGIAGVNILPVGNRGAIFAPQVPILDFDRQIDTQERGRMVRDAIGDGMALVLKNHGVAVCGDSIENAVIATFSLEETAQLHWIAARLGTVQKISTGEVRSVLTGARKEEFYSHVWGHYARLDPWEQHHSLGDRTSTQP